MKQWEEEKERKGNEMKEEELGEGVSKERKRRKGRET